MKRHVLLMVLFVAALAGAATAWIVRYATRTPPALEQATLLDAARPLPDFELADQAGRPFGRDRLRGHWTLMFFGFTNCPDVCPTTLATLAEVRRKLADLPATDLPDVVLVSVDPARDTPELLGRYVVHFDPRFVGITGPPPSLEVLTRDLGVAFSIGPPSEDGNYSVDHSAAIFLIDPDGAFAAVFGSPHVADVIARDYRSHRRCGALMGSDEVNSRSLRDRAFVGLQYLLPQHFLSRVVGSVAHARIGWLKQALIRAFLRHYAVDLSEAERSDPSTYDSFNDFFTRKLRAGARPSVQDPASVACPVDGYVSQAGLIQAGELLQAKGLSYTASALLGGDAALAAQFTGGAFATMYLAPHNYHRIHMPLAGTLRVARHVPGDLFSVNTTTADGVPGLFARNERVVCVFDTAAGPMAVVLVGALFVGSMSLSWAGVIRGRYPRAISELPVRPVIALDRGAELGWFNMGSTVILMFTAAGPALVPGLVPGRALRVGERIAACP